MTQSEAIERLRAALGQIDAVIAAGRDGAAGAEWRLSTSLLFEAVFGPNHQFTKSHRSVDYYIPTSSVFRGDPTTEVARLSREAYERGMETHRGILRAAIASVERDGIPERRDEPAKSDGQPRIFLTHGSADDVLDAVSHFIEDDLGFRAVVMKRSATEGSAVDDAVPALMESCDAVVILGTADDKQQDGTFNPRPNVIHEIGLAVDPTNVVYRREAGATPPMPPCGRRAL